MKKVSFLSRVLLIFSAIFFLNAFDLYSSEDFKAWEFKTGQTGIACGKLNFTDRSITIEFWINMTQAAAGTDKMSVLETFGDPNGFIVNIRQNSTKSNALELRLFAKDRQATPAPVYFFIPSDKYINKWAHIAFVISEADQKAYAYINGELFGTTNAIGGYYGNYKSDGVTTRALNIGTYYSDPKFLGKLADVRIWSVARSAQQIKDNYNRHIEGIATGLVVNYKFLTYERGFINDANPSVATNKGWCNPDVSWSTYYATETLSTYPRNSSLSNGLLQWNTSAGAWEVAVYKASDNTNVFIDTIATNSVLLRDISELGVGVPYYAKVRTQNNGFCSNSVVSGNFSIDRYYRYSGNGAWNDPANWEKSYDNTNWTNANVVPTSASATTITIQNGQAVVVDGNMAVNSLTINAGGKLTINEGVTPTIGSVVLESNSTTTATLVDSYATPTLSASVQQYVEAGRNWYVSAPVSESVFSALNKGDYITTFNEVTKNWETINSGNLVPGKGYIQVANASQGTTGNVTFSGLLNSGDVTVQLSRTESGNNRGFNLVGNPYPSYLDWSKVAAANPNVLPTAWFRTKKTTEAGGGYTFATVNVENETPIIVSGGANTLVTNYIPPMQAYWVRLVVNPTVTDYTVTNAMRDHTDNVSNRLKAPRNSNLKLARLLVTSGLDIDETVLYFNQKASDSFDRFDSPKMFNNSVSAPNIYTRIGSEKLVINGMNSVKFDEQIPLGFSTDIRNDFSISLSEMTNFEANVKLVLIDNLLKTETDLTDGKNYEFSSDSTQSTGRFSLVFKVKSVTTGLWNTDVNGFYAYKAMNNQIVVNADSRFENNAVVSIYNAIGQRLETIALTDAKTVSQGKFEKGVYVVSVVFEGKTNSQKVIIN